MAKNLQSGGPPSFFFWLSGILAYVAYMYGNEKNLPFTTHLLLYLPAVMVPMLIGKAYRNQAARVEQQVRNLQAREIYDSLAAGEKPDFTLFLRPFDSADQYLLPLDNKAGFLVDMIKRTPGEENVITVEDALATALRESYPLLAFERDERAIGPGQVQVPDESWQKEFQSLARAARLVVAMPLVTEFMELEVTHLQEEGLLSKCLFIMPPEAYFGKGKFDWEKVREVYGRHELEFPEQDIDGMIFTLASSGSLKQTLPLGDPVNPDRFCLMVAELAENMS